jgi:hypothetical protein
VFDKSCAGRDFGRILDISERSDTKLKEKRVNEREIQELDSTHKEKGIDDGIDISLA